MDPTRATARLISSVGTKVEVLFEENSVGDVWFPATIVEELGNNLCLVEYECLGDNDEAELRRVTVDYLHIRPSTPQLRDTNFVLLEKVDAFYDFGWWSGVITKKLADSRYIVYFKHTNKVRELSHLELRPHVEWKVDTPYQVCVSNVDSVGGNGESNSVKCSTEERTTVSLNSTDLSEDTTCDIDKQTSIVTTTMKRTKSPNVGSNDKQLKSSKNLKAGISPDDPSLSEVGKSKEVSNPPVTAVGQFGDHNTQLALIGDKASGKTENISRGKRMNGKRGKSVGLNPPTITSTRKRGRLSADFRGNKALTQGTTDDSRKGTTLDIIEKEHVTKDLPPIVIGLQSIVTASSKGKKLQQFPNEKSSNIAEAEIPELGVTSSPKMQSIVTAPSKGKKLQQFPSEKSSNIAEAEIPGLVVTSSPKMQSVVTASSKRKKLQQFPIEKSPNIAEGDIPELGVTSSLKMAGNAEGKESDSVTISKRKRGRPPKLQAKSSRTSLAANRQNGNAVPDAVAAAGTASGKENLVQEKEQLQSPRSNNVPNQKTSESSVDIPVIHVDKSPDGSSVKALTVQQEKLKPVKGKRGKRRTISSINTESSPQDCQDPSKQKANGGSEKDSATGNSQVHVEKSPDTMSDDQPLSRWFEGMHTSATIDRTAANKKHTENAKDPLAVAADGENLSTGANKKHTEDHTAIVAVGENLSIEKRSSLWQNLESMQLFRMVPQKPHFRPLVSTKESLREGQAISKMVTFVSVVENTGQLRFESPRSMIEEYLEVLVDLESHGFDVKLIRNRLTELLLVKEEQEELEGQSKEVRDKIEAECIEVDQINKEMEYLDEQIQVLMRKRKEMLLNKERKDSETAVLEAVGKEVKEYLLKAQHKFDSIAAAPLYELEPSVHR